MCNVYTLWNWNLTQNMTTVLCFLHVEYQYFLFATSGKSSRYVSQQWFVCRIDITVCAMKWWIILRCFVTKIFRSSQNSNRSYHIVYKTWSHNCLIWFYTKFTFEINFVYTHFNTHFNTLQYTSLNTHGQENNVFISLPTMFGSSCRYAFT